MGDAFVNSANAARYADEFLHVEHFICLYFGASWAAPCQEFEPMLIDFYHKVNKNHRRVEIVYVHSDEDNGQFNNAITQVPWLAVPYGDSRVMEIKQFYAVTAVPVLVVLRKDGTLVTTNGRNDLYALEEKAIDHWL